MRTTWTFVACMRPFAKSCNHYEILDAKVCAEHRVRFIYLSPLSMEIWWFEWSWSHGTIPSDSCWNSVHKLRVDVQIPCVRQHLWMTHHFMLTGEGTTCLVLRVLTGIAARCHAFPLSFDFVPAQDYMLETSSPRFYIWGFPGPGFGPCANFGARGPGAGSGKPKNQEPQDRLADLLINHRFTNKSMLRFLGFLGFPNIFGLTANAQTMLLGAKQRIYMISPLYFLLRDGKIWSPRGWLKVRTSISWTTSVGKASKRRDPSSSSGRISLIGCCRTFEAPQGTKG